MVVHIDETGINKQCFKIFGWIEKKDKGKKHAKTTVFTNISVITAICEYEIISYKFREGAYDNFSFKIYLEELIDIIKNKELRL